MRDRNHVGELRPSQLMHTYGVGAMVELPEMTTLVLGLDDWPHILGEAVSEPRLLAAVRDAAGSQVEQLLTPPVVPDGDRAGVPVAPFPRWLRCPVCSLLSPIDHGVFTFRPDPYRPERTTFVHDGCPHSHSRRPPTAFPARYLMACQNGHLDDFPWVEFLHGGVPCKGTLRLRELGAGGRAGDVQLDCDGCGRRRRLSQAFGEDARPFLPPRCRGRHPHLGTTETCDQQPVTLILGASNAWFPVQSSALSIPSQAGELAQKIDDAWSILGVFPPGIEVLEATLKTHPDLKDLRALAEKLGIETVHDAVQARREGLDDGDPADLRTPEWRVFCAPQEAPELDDFKLRAVGPPAQYAGLLADVVLAERLREVSALRGFTRLNAPDDLAARGGNIVRLSREAPRWLPCSEVRGEGIFIRFSEDAVLEWEARYLESGASAILRDGHHAWRDRRNLPPDEGWPGERYVLLHSLAHVLIRELALECGYTASSIRERLYASSTPSEEPMAGVLLYTSAPDSEGTLGGLVSLGEPEQLGTAAAPGARARSAVLVGSALLRARPAHRQLRSCRRLSRVPVRLRDIVRAGQPVPRPCHARPHPRPCRRGVLRRAMNVDDTVAAVLERLSDAQIESLADTCEPLRRPTSGLATVVAGAPPASVDAVTAVASAWATSPELTGAGIALALRSALRARREADRRQARPVWTGPGSVGVQRLTSAVLHGLVTGARERILLVSYAAYTLPELAADLADAIGRGCDVDVVFETEEDSAGAYSGPHSKPFGAVTGLRRWRWPPGQRDQPGAALHAKVLVVDGCRALVGSANLTHRALQANLEAGVLVEDEAVAAALERHVRSLMDEGTLVRALPEA